MPLVLKNNASSTLAGGISAVATSISVQTGDASKFPVMTAGDWHPVTVTDGAGNIEIMRCTGRSGGVLTVVRAQEGTTAFAFSAGASVQLRMTAASLLEVLNDKIGSDGPTIFTKIILEGLAPYIQLRDTDNAGTGKNYFIKNNADVFSITRDMNADGDDEDTNETALIPLKLDGANLQATTDFAFKSNALQWVRHIAKDNTNLNDLMTSGFYLGSNFTNSPNGTGPYFLMVQRGQTDNNIQQTAWAYDLTSPPVIYTRTKNGGVWGAWAVIVCLTSPSGAGAGKVKVPAYQNDGAATSFILDTATGAALINTSTADAARAVLAMGPSDAPAFGRVHSGGVATAFDFGSATNECAYLNGSTIRASKNGQAPAQFQRTGSNGNIVSFFRGTTSVGEISVTGTATAYGTSSDYRLKTDVKPLVSFSLGAEEFDFLPDTLRRLMATRPVSYRWIADGKEGEIVTGYIAHELQSVFPTAVNGAKDEVVAVGTGDMGDAEEIRNVTRDEAMEAGAAAWSQTGTRPVYQSVDHSKMVPSLNAGLQELVMIVLEQRKMIEDLQGRVASLGA